MAHWTIAVSGPVLVGVIGPPGAGKSTVDAELAVHSDVLVFRLREAVRARPNFVAGEPSTDPIGWVSTDVVRRVLDALVQDRFGAGAPLVLLDNFPGTAEQLALLADIATRTATHIALLELRTHAPALAALNDPHRCRTCHTGLSRRDTDTPDHAAQRHARYAVNRPQIAAYAARHRSRTCPSTLTQRRPKCAGPPTQPCTRSPAEPHHQGVDHACSTVAHANPAPRPRSGL